MLILEYHNRPLYTIGVVAEMVRLHPQTLRRYEDLGLVAPARASGRRFYSQRDIDRLLQIVRLTDELGVNLAGVEVILRLRDRVSELQAENESIRAQLGETPSVS
jgi:MerR family transcriptional regulator/heat shock protein HspR